MNAIFHITFMISSQLILLVNMIAVISVKCQTKEIHCSSPLPPPPPPKIIKLGLERQRPSIKTLINVRLIRLFTTSLFVHNVER